MIIKPARSIVGEINLPGDKSISHRAAIFAALADGATRIENFSEADDCASTLDCLENLGVEIRRERATIYVKGVGKNNLRKPAAALDCGNSGTTVRLLAGVLAGQNFDSVLTGDQSLKQRPMKRVITPLELMGAKIISNENFLPLEIKGKNPLTAIEYDLPIASAQVKSCVLLAGLNAAGKTVVKNPPTNESVPASRNHTELMLANLGAKIEEKFIRAGEKFVHAVTIDGDSRLTAKDLIVPADISAAAFFAVAAVCLKDSAITIKNVGLNPTRTAFLDVLQNLGADFETGSHTISGGEIIGDLIVRGGANLAAENNLIGGDAIANLIDEVPILAVLGTQIENGLEIRDAGELRVKESDRIAAIAENLRRMNARVTEFPDGLRVEKSRLKGAAVDSFGDHRIAMAFAVA
ncbi:MAG: 3-phosphoshikimate 1-carboxyvinyltransferase, partial [Pyrinomonadaceae bacterium]